jgi:hypothetical protein
VLIHVRCTSHSIFLSNGNNAKKLQLFANINFSQILNVISLLILSDFEIAFGRIQ